MYKARIKFFGKDDPTIFYSVLNIQSNGGMITVYIGDKNEEPKRILFYNIEVIEEIDVLRK